MRVVMLGLGGKAVKKTLAICAVIFLLSLVAACGGSVRPEFTYQGDFLPFAIHYTPPNHFSISGERAFVTPIGEFSVGAEYELPQGASDSIYVILRNRSTGFDKIYQVHTDGEQFTAVVNGHTTISILKDQVLIDVTKGNIQQISFKKSDGQIAESAGGKNWFASSWHGTNARWDAGWSQSWYHPYGLAKWAYDDSTIEKWYGAGFIVFLARLVFSIALAFVDTLLTLGFLVGQAGFMVFGPTGRDAIYGLEVLMVVVIIGVSVANS